MAAGVESQRVKFFFVLREQPQDFLAPFQVRTVLSPGAHHELRFLCGFDDRGVVSSPYGIFAAQ